MGNCPMDSICLKISPYRVSLAYILNPWGFGGNIIFLNLSLREINGLLISLGKFNINIIDCAHQQRFLCVEAAKQLI